MTMTIWSLLKITQSWHEICLLCREKHVSVIQWQHVM